MCYCPTPTLHLNLALTGDGAFLFSLKKTHSVWFISVLNYGDTENVLINHLLLVIPMSYPCHYTNLCPRKPHKHAHTHTHTHTHTAGAATRHREWNWVILSRDKDSGADSRSWNLAKRPWQCHIMNSRSLGGVITIPVTTMWKKVLLKTRK